MNVHWKFVGRQSAQRKHQRVESIAMFVADAPYQLAESFDGIDPRFPPSWKSCSSWNCDHYDQVFRYAERRQ